LYKQDDRLVESTLTNPGGHCVAKEKRSLLAGDTHKVEEIVTDPQMWSARNNRQVVDKKTNEEIDPNGL
jgi:hypothetical protein